MIAEKLLIAPDGYEKHKQRFDAIMYAVVKVTKVRKAQIVNHNRGTSATQIARHMFCYLARFHTNATYKQIAFHIDRKTHDNILQSCKTFEGFLQTMPELRVEFEEAHTTALEKLKKLSFSTVSFQYDFQSEYYI